MLMFTTLTLHLVNVLFGLILCIFTRITNYVSWYDFYYYSMR